MNRILKTFCTPPWKPWIKEYSLFPDLFPSKGVLQTFNDIKETQSKWKINHSKQRVIMTCAEKCDYCDKIFNNAVHVKSKVHWIRVLQS